MGKKINLKKVIDIKKIRGILPPMQVRDGHDITRALSGVITDLLNRGDAESDVMADVLTQVQFVVYATNTKLDKPQRFNHTNEIAHADRLFIINTRGNK